MTNPATEIDEAVARADDLVADDKNFAAAVVLATAVRQYGTAAVHFEAANGALKRAQSSPSGARGAARDLRELLVYVILDEVVTSERPPTQPQIIDVDADWDY